MKVVITLMLIGWATSPSVCGSQYCMGCSESGECNVCNHDLHYIADRNGDCILHYDEKCQLMGEDGGCYTCPNNTIPYKSTCVYPKGDFANCLRVDCEDFCTRCAPQKILQDNACRALTAGETLPSNCRYGNVDLDCLECNYNYFLYNGKCYSNPSNCVAPSICSKCAKNAFIEPLGKDQIQLGFWDKFVSLDKTKIFMTDLSGCVKNNDAECLEAFSSTKCKRCIDGNYLTSTFLCQTAVDNDHCVERDMDGVCTACVKDYFIDLTANPKVCKAKWTVDPNCRTYSTSTLCDICLPHFYHVSKTDITQNRCQEVTNKVIGCFEYGSDGKCSYCDSSDGLKKLVESSGVQTCNNFNATKPPNCIAFDNNNECMGCEDNYRLNNSKGCDYDGGTPGEETATCIKKNSLGQCISCSGDSFVDDSGTCLPRNIDKCKVYAEAGKCKYCEKGFYVSDNVCTASLNSTSNPEPGYFANCVYTGLDKCLVCEPNFNVNDADKVCKPFAIENCEAYGSDQQCLFCHAGFYYEGVTNECIRRDFPNCERQIKVGSNYLCKLCLRGTIPSTDEKSCDSYSSGFVEVKRCMNYDKTGKCIRCEQGFDLVASATDATKNVCNRPPTNFNACCEYLEGGSCVECLTSEYLNSSKQCVKRNFETDYCETYTNGVCYKCIFNATQKYVLNTNNECVPFVSGTYNTNNCFLKTDTKCDLCDNQTLLFNDVCTTIPVKDTCELYTPDPFTCASCEGGYVAGGECRTVTSGTSGAVNGCTNYNSPESSNVDPTCKTCGSNFYKAGNSCVPYDTIPNCVKFTNAFICEYCKEDFYPDENGQCQSYTSITVPECTRWDTNKTCLLCGTTTFLKTSETSKTCDAIEKDLTNCLEMNADFDCARCEAGYYKNSDNYCDKVQTADKVTNCEFYSDKDTCSQCLANSTDGFFAVTDDGKECVANCLDASGTDSAPVCEQCISGYIWVQADPSDASSLACTKIIDHPNGSGAAGNLSEIAGCELHSFATKLICVQCQDNYLKSADSSSCEEVVGMSDCDVVDPASPQCSLCANRFTLGFNGSCVVPKTADATCLFNDSEYPMLKSTEMPSLGSCLVCQTGYHEVTDGTCAANSKTATQMNTYFQNWLTAA